MLQEKLNSLLENYPLLTTEVFSNSFSKWIIAVVIFFLTYFFLKIFKAVILSRLKKIAQKTKNEFDDVIINGLDAIHWPFNIFIGFYLAQYSLNVTQRVGDIMHYILIITVSYYLIRVIQASVDVFMRKLMVQKGDKEGQEMIKLISTIIKVGLWGIAILLVLSNLGYNVNSLVAGLGVSGIVIAFAVQKVASDLFSSLSIYFDKPFKSGDFVAIGTDKGTIKSIGMRTTRLTNLTGEELVIPNSEIVSVRIQNFGNMERRRVAFNIGVTYNTPKIKLEAIPEMIKNIIKKQKKATYDRCYFKDFGDFSLGFDIVYYVETNEYEDYLKIQQAINLAIVEHFEKEKIEIAFPTQTVHVVK